MKHHTPSTRRRFIALAVAAVALLAVPLGAAPAFAGPDKSPVAKHVALGDSYAAGQGAGIVLDASDSCLRTDSGYAAQLDAVPNYNLLRQPACSGATIDDVMASQLSAINRGTTLVTVTAGANDLGINQVTAACANDPQMQGAPCQVAIGTAQVALAGIGTEMTALIEAISDRSPRATIVVTGYPQLFASILEGVPLVQTVNQAVAGLNDQLAGAVSATAAAGAGVVFAPVDFGEHAIGGSDTWWLGFSLTDPDPFTFMHPTVDGYGAYTDAILAALQ